MPACTLVSGQGSPPKPYGTAPQCVLPADESVLPACVWGVGLSHVDAEFPVLAFQSPRHWPSVWACTLLVTNRGLVSKLSGATDTMG